MIGPLVQRRLRLVLYVVVANVLTGVVLLGLQSWMTTRTPDDVANTLASGTLLAHATAPTTQSLGQLTATYVILAPALGVRWRRAGLGLLAVLSALALVLSAYLPVTLFLSLSVGATAGCAVLLAFGRPDARPTADDVAQALARNGLPVERLTRTDSRSATAYVADRGDAADGLFVKVLGVHERSADLFYRLTRYLHLRDIGDESPFASPQRALEHEALGAMRATAMGVRTPRLRALSDIDGSSHMLVFDRVDGIRMQDWTGPIDDELLAGIWAQVGLMRAGRLAHRDLRRGKVLIGGAAPVPQAWIVGFGASDVIANDEQLRADLAQALVTVALSVGSERAVDTAIASVGKPALADALPLLQTNALAPATRAALHRHAGLLDELASVVAERCAVGPVSFVELERVSRKTLFTVAMLVAATYFLAPQFADLPEIMQQIGAAAWIWVIPAVLVSLVTFVGAAIALAGSVLTRLRLWRATIAQVAASFAGVVTPAGVGGMAVNVRFLQKAGVDSAVAVSAVGLDAVAGVVVHIVMLLVFLIWAGSSVFGPVTLPSPQALVYGLGAVLVLAAVAFAVPWVRRTVRTSLVPLLERSIAGLRVVLTRPGKLAMLFGGSTLITTGYICALYLSMQAFDGALSISQVGAVYLVGVTVASVAPTPGGLGAVEAALIAGLIAAGLANTVAVPTVFLFRLITFWLPVVPGWIAIGNLRRRDEL